VLHGHTHLNSLYSIDGPDKKVPVLGVPAAGQIPGGKKPAGRYNLISIDGKPGAWSCNLQEFGFVENPNSPTVQLLGESQLLS